MWRWITDFAGPDRRETWNEVGARVLTALGGYVRGIALVGLVDAVLIGIVLLVIGVPLVVPLMVLTFIAAFLPLIGAFLAGLAAVLIALVSNGLVAALSSSARSCWSSRSRGTCCTRCSWAGPCTCIPR